jgi:mannose-6-phosphate isomerase-like protein (cupin superfamily)
MSSDTITLSPVQTLRIVTSSPDLLEVEATWTTGGKPPPTHWHPRQTERFEVLEGQLTVEIGGAPPRVLEAGDVLDVPPRTAHRMWNAGPATARASWRITPAFETERMFRFIEGGLSKGRSLLMLVRFRREFRLGTP